MFQSRRIKDCGYSITVTQKQKTDDMRLIRQEARLLDLVFVIAICFCNMFLFEQLFIVYCGSRLLLAPLLLMVNLKITVRYRNMEMRWRVRWTKGWEFRHCHHGAVWIHRFTFVFLLSLRIWVYLMPILNQTIKPPKQIILANFQILSTSRVIYLLNFKKRFMLTIRHQNQFPHVSTSCYFIWYDLDWGFVGLV